MIDKSIMEDAYPITKMQMGMIYHGMNGEMYHDVASYYVNRNLDEKYFKQTVELLTEKHEILRTVFSIYDYKQPIQVVLMEYNVNVGFFDISDIPKKFHKSKIDELCEEEEKKKFSLDGELLIRFFAIKLSENEFQIMLSFHHAILDGWSIQKLVTEFIDVYYALMAGKELNMSSLETTFSDYVASELEVCSSKEYMNFWREYLEGINPSFLAEGEQKNTFQVVESVIQGEQYNKIYVLCDKLHISVKTYIKAATLIAVMNELKTHTYVMGEVTHGRLDCEDGENVLGMFLNTIPLKLTSKASTFEEIIKVIATDELKKYPFRRYPLFEMLGERKEELFDVLFNYTKFDIANAYTEVTDYERRTFIEKTNYKLTVHGSEIQGVIRLVFNYDASVVNKDLVLKILKRMNKVLFDTELTTNPWDNLCGKLAVVSGEKVEFSCGTLVTRFLKQVEKTPYAVAVQFLDRTLSYKEFNDISNRIANYLVGKGLQKDKAVVVLMSRSIEMLAVIYGIIKAGGAYVPLDTKYPSERIAYIVQEIKPVCMIADDTTTLYTDFDINVITKDEIKEIAKNGDKSNCDKSCNDGLAYIIYTSGSTGKPKGVMIEHRSIVNRLDWMQRQFNLDYSDVVLQKTPYTFDVSLWELFWTLQQGAKLVIAPPDVHKDSMYMVNMIKELGITTIHFVPSMLNVFMQCDMSKCNSLKRVICSGEELSAAVVNKFYDYFKEGSILYNLYGPTEAAVDVTYWKCSRMDEVSKVPIGYAVDNTEIYILDQDLQPIYTEDVGEICLAGIQLARGYINQLELTEEKFVTVEIGGQKKRVYRTGDIGYIKNGVVMYCGRIDFQVKLKGFRIELGEVENIINSFPKVSESVVLLKEHKEGSQMLVAYVSGIEIDETEMNEYLKKFLPEYMIPSKLILTEDMPHLSNGKLNRKELQNREVSFEKMDFVYPRTDMEEAVAAIWSSVLGVKKVSVNCKFEELGGDSLKALVLVGRIAKNLQTQFTLTDLALYNTVALISEFITLGEKSPSSNLICFKPSGNKEPFFCIHPFGGHVYTYGNIGKYFDQNRPFYGIQAEGLDGVSEPLESIEEMAEKYILEIKKVQQNGPYYIGGWCMGGLVAYEVAKQLINRGETVAKIIVINSSIVEEVPSHMRINDLELFKYAIAQTSELTADTSACDDVEKRMHDLYEEAVKKEVIRGDINSFSQAEHMFKIYKAHRKAMMEYCLKPLPIKGILIKASENHLKDNINGFLGWEKVMEVKRYVVEGTHYNIFLEPHVKKLANVLTCIMEEK